MKSLNQHQVIGNLTRDVEVNYTGTGKAAANLSVACNYSYKDADGEWQEGVDFVNVTLFGPSAEFAGKYGAKGRKVYVSGRVRTRKWQDREGNDRYSTETVANQFFFLDYREAEAETEPAPVAKKNGKKSAPVKKPVTAPADPEFDPDDDLPF